MEGIYSIYSESFCRLEKSQSYLENFFTYHSIRLKNSSKIAMQLFSYKAKKNREHFCCYLNEKVWEGFVVAGIQKKISKSINSISIPSTKAGITAHQVWWDHQTHRRRSDKGKQCPIQLQVSAGDICSSKPDCTREISRYWSV